MNENIVELTFYENGSRMWQVSESFPQPKRTRPKTTKSKAKKSENNTETKTILRGQTWHNLYRYLPKPVYIGADMEKQQPEWSSWKYNYTLTWNHYGRDLSQYKEAVERLPDVKRTAAHKIRRNVKPLQEPNTQDLYERNTGKVREYNYNIENTNIHERKTPMTYLRRTKTHVSLLPKRQNQEDSGFLTCRGHKIFRAKSEKQIWGSIQDSIVNHYREGLR